MHRLVDFLPRALSVVAVASALVLGSTSGGSAAASQSCGKVGGVPIHAHNLSCKTARRTYKADMAGKLPAGWSCSASLARCYRGEVGGSSEYMWWRRTTYRPLATSVVLGGRIYGGERGEGWGSERPEIIYNGGDPSGLIAHVHWSTWGGAVARGHGQHAIFKPRSGYYHRPVVAQLKAKQVGRCEGRSAYLKLLIREPKRPGGRPGPWRSWSGPRTICEPYG